MRSYSLNIAGYRIRFESEDNGPELLPSEKFTGYLKNNGENDLNITVHSGKFELPSEAVMVFDAPYVEEINGVRFKKSDKFWSVHKLHSDIFIKTTFPLSSGRKHAILKFSLSERNWDLWFNKGVKETDPMEYPLDGLVIYYLTVMYGDILIHASGVYNAGRGYLFSGISGKGKTTMAKLWDRSGATVIHDDRLVIRFTGMQYEMHNTPVYRNDSPSKSVLNKIFLIEHGRKNELIRVSGAQSITMVMANCIQHNWNQEIIARLVGSVSLMCTSISVFRLSFKPDRSVIDEILENE
jgi:hypothetical protein